MINHIFFKLLILLSIQKAKIERKINIQKSVLVRIDVRKGVQVREVYI